MHHKLLMQPQRLLGEHCELVVGDLVEVYAREVMADVSRPLPDTLIVLDRPGIYKPTRVL